MMVTNFLWVAAGGGIGSMLRYGASVLFKDKLYPLATFSVNLTGCFIIGIVFALSLRQNGLAEHWKLFLATGICGGFTTFSAFSLENMGMLQSGRYGAALVYTGLSLVLGIAATFLGYTLVMKN
ncbi:MAG TPA: fluoride efflux transporter CrcB [Ferruginibacter sp.]|nr:fluoride efflux transporter CrcB [Ferruginibacter sp.]